MNRYQAVMLLCLLLWPAMPGCRLLPSWMNRQPVELPPEAFTEPPTLDDVIYVVNSNTERVRQLQTESATLQLIDAQYRIPPLKANIAYEQPRNFRLQAQLSQFTGRELDLGSNHDLFWLWIKRGEPHVYYARHDEFASSPARDLIPIEPYRLADALGLVRLDANERHSEPTQRDNLLEIRSQIPSPRGNMTRVLVIDATYGWMVEQHYYDANGQLLLSARAAEHRYYPENAVSMPHHVEVRLLPGQPTQLAFELDVGRYLFNRLTGPQAERWSLPQIEGSPAVDIADPQFRPPVAAMPYDSAGGRASYGMAPYGTSPGGAIPPSPASRYGVAGPGQPAYVPTQTASLPAYRGYR